jgi:hypothetical protein
MNFTSIAIGSAALFLIAATVAKTAPRRKDTKPAKA